MRKGESFDDVGLRANSLRPVHQATSVVDVTAKAVYERMKVLRLGWGESSSDCPSLTRIVVPWSV